MPSRLTEFLSLLLDEGIYRCQRLAQGRPPSPAAGRSSFSGGGWELSQLRDMPSRPAARKTLRSVEFLHPDQMAATDPVAMAQANDRALALAIARSEDDTSPGDAQAAATQALLVDRQPDALSRQPAIWSSTTQPGTYGLHVPGRGAYRARTLDEAQFLLRGHAIEVAEADKGALAAEQDGHLAARLMREEIGAALGPLATRVTVCDARPGPRFQQPAIWPSAMQAGAFGVRVPGAADRRAATLAEARAMLAPHDAPRAAGGSGAARPRPADPSPQQLAELASRHDIDITPIMVDGREIGHLYRGSAAASDGPATVMLSCHGTAVNESATLRKPARMDFDFAAPTNTILHSSTKEFFRRYRDGQVAFTDPSQVYDEPDREMTDYRLTGNIGTTAQEMAQLVGAMHQGGSGGKFDMVLLKPSADIHLSTLLRGLRETLGEDAYSKMVCHFCRPKEAAAQGFDVASNFSGAPPWSPSAGPVPVPAFEAQPWTTPPRDMPRPTWPSAQAEALDRLGGDMVFDDVVSMDPQFTGEQFGTKFGTAVEYLDRRQREEFRVTIRNGKLHDAKGRLFDSRKAASVFKTGSGSAIFVMDHRGRLYLSNRQTAGKFHHSSFLAGAPVAAAGEIVVHRGVVMSISRKSNHYKPTEKQSATFADHLVSQGVAPTFTRTDLD